MTRIARSAFILLALTLAIGSGCDPAEDLKINDVANSAGDVLSGDFSDDSKTSASAAGTSALSGSSGTVVCLGDSLTSENGEQAWPRQLAAMAGRNVIGLGYGGARLAEVVAALPGTIDRNRPSVVLIMAGTNDVQAGFTRAGVAKSVALAASTAAAGGAKLVFLTIPAFTRGAAVAEPSVVAYNAALTAAASSAGVPVLDAHAALDGCTDCYDADGVHLSPQGSMAVAESALPALR